MKRVFAVIGLGYVGLELAVCLAKHFEVMGFDASKDRIEELKEGYDRNHIVSRQRLESSSLEYFDVIEGIREASFYIVAVPTPAYYYELPDLDCLISATKNLAKILKKGDIVVYESTVSPGTTEEVCIDLLEKESELKHQRDFNVAFSPERINPGDSLHEMKNIVKVVGAQNEKTLKEITSAYEKVFKHIHPVSSIKVAEASKILENTQRDVNIALMNEFSKIMHAIDVDVHEVLDAAKTKWNFAPFSPGLVGGHCISVDPLYLAFQAKRKGVEPAVILSARKVNDGMPAYILDELFHLLIKKSTDFEALKIGIFGVTYKANVPDVRNSLMLKLIKLLSEYPIQLAIHDPRANKGFLSEKYGIDLLDDESIHDMDVILLAVGHDEYLNQGLSHFVNKIRGSGVFMDIPNAFPREEKSDYPSIQFWNL